MSSTLRHFSLIPARTKYLLGVTSGNSNLSGPPSSSYLGNSGASVVRIPSSIIDIVGSVATISEVEAARIATGASPFAFAPWFNDTGALIGKLFKDLGRSLTIYDSTLDGDLHITTYRECQYINGPTTEGVPQSEPTYGGNYWVRIWSADGIGVAVARTG